jgi:hypothetical protein
MCETHVPSIVKNFMSKSSFDARAWQNPAVVRYIKALGVALCSAIAAAALYSAVKEAWAFLYIALVLAPRAEAASDGLSWDAYYPQTFDLRGPLIIGFVVGFWWMFRRQAVAPREPTQP